MMQITEACAPQFLQKTRVISSWQTYKKRQIYGGFQGGIVILRFFAPDEFGDFSGILAFFGFFHIEEFEAFSFLHGGNR